MSEKRTDAELLALMANVPRPGSPWRHYKTGKLYWVQCNAIGEATQQPLVVYHQQSSAILFARPLSEWEELVEWDGGKVPRFCPP